MYEPFDQIDINKKKGDRIKATEWNAVCRQLNIFPNGNGFCGDATSFNPPQSQNKIQCLGISYDGDIEPYSVFAVHPAGGQADNPPVFRVCKAGTVSNGIMAALGLFTNGPNKIYDGGTIQSVIYPIGNDIIQIRSEGSALTVGQPCGVYNSYSLNSSYGGFICVGSAGSKQEAIQNRYYVLKSSNMMLFGECETKIKGGDETIKVKIAEKNDFTTGSTIINAFNYFLQDENMEINAGDKVSIVWSDYNLRWVLTAAECVPEEEE